MLRRSHRYFGDFRSVPKLGDEFSASLSRQSTKYDHVLIDIGPFAGIGTNVVKGLKGNDRDAETSTFIQRQIFGVVMRKYSAAKSIGLFFDGSDPLWKSHRSRKFPSKKHENRFYRSCASPLPWMCEERLRTAIADTARGKILPEFTISGPATAGPVEAKMSAYLNDLAARFVDPAGAVYTPAGAASASTPAGPLGATVTPTDSILIVGMDEALLTGLGALPFTNITAVLMDGRDLKSLTMAEGLEWMTMQNLGKPATPAGPGAANTLQQQKARVDAIILYLLANGCGTTDLPSVGVNFGDLMSSYMDSQTIGGGATGGAGNFLCDLTAPQSPSNSGNKVSVGIDLLRLERVLAKASRKQAAAAKEDHQAADFLEILLQTVAMFVDGGIKNNSFVPAHPLYENPSPLRMDQLLGHIKFLQASGAAAAGNTVVTSASPGNSSAAAKVIVPSISPDSFALTAAEQLLVSATLPPVPVGNAPAGVAPESPNASAVEAVKAIHPSFLGGHELPEKALNAVLGTANVKEAAETARDILSFIDPNSEVGSFHPGLRHAPSYYFYQTKTVGPPAGYEYMPVNLGYRSDEQQTRAAVLSKAVCL